MCFSPPINGGIISNLSISRLDIKFDTYCMIKIRFETLPKEAYLT